MFMRLADCQADFETADGLKGNVSLPLGGNAIIVQVYPPGKSIEAWDTFQLDLSEIVKAAIRWHTKKHQKVKK